MDISLSNFHPSHCLTLLSLSDLNARVYSTVESASKDLRTPSVWLAMTENAIDDEIGKLCRDSGVYGDTRDNMISWSCQDIATGVVTIDGDAILRSDFSIEFEYCRTFRSLTFWVEKSWWEFHCDVDVTSVERIYAIEDDCTQEEENRRSRVGVRCCLLSC